MVTSMHLLAAALLFVGPPPGDTLAGRVTDSDGAPVPSAAVLISELHRVATSGTDGAFRLADVPPGEYTVIVRHVGFAPFARAVAVHGPTNLTVMLRRAPVWIEPLSITPTRAPSAVLGSPLSAAALSEDGLRRDQSVSLAHSLARLPGVNARTTGAQIGKPMIRGLAGARVLVLANGNRLEDYSWSDEDGPSVDARLAQRVELIRGPASVLYGSDALGGVVNVIPEELPDANRGPSTVRSAFELSGASNNAELAAAARLEGASGTWGWRLFGIGRLAGSLHTPAGELDNTGFNALSGEATVGTRGARGGTTLRYTRAHAARPRRTGTLGRRFRVRGDGARGRLELPRRRSPRPAAAHRRLERHARSHAAAAGLHGALRYRGRGVPPPLRRTPHPHGQSRPRVARPDPVRAVRPRTAPRRGALRDRAAGAPPRGGDQRGCRLAVAGAGRADRARRVPQWPRP